MFLFVFCCCLLCLCLRLWHWKHGLIWQLTYQFTLLAMCVYVPMHVHVWPVCVLRLNQFLVSVIRISKLSNSSFTTFVSSYLISSFSGSNINVKCWYCSLHFPRAERGCTPFNNIWSSEWECWNEEAACCILFEGAYFSFSISWFICLTTFCIAYHSFLI